MSNRAPLTFTLPFGRRVLLFGCITIFCFVITSVLAFFIGATTPARIRILSVVQDVTLFILPAIATAMLVTRRPAQLLMLDSYPRSRSVVLTALCVVCGMPLIEASIYLNSLIPLPESLLQLERMALLTIQQMFGSFNVPSLIVALLIIGIMAPLSEELFFRGTVQRLISTSGINIHIAIWLTAVIFSAVHMEFSGFLPRTLLGAFFGYAMWWSGSLWLAVGAHMFNNILSAVEMWIRVNHGLDIESEPSLPAWWLFGGSVVLVVLLLSQLRRSCR